MRQEYKLFQNGPDGVLETALLDRRIHGQSWKAYSYASAWMAVGNRLPSPARLVKLTGISKSSMARCYRELCGAGVFLKREGDYYMNPKVAWRGTWAAWHDALQWVPDAD